MTGRRSHGRLSALNGVVHQGSVELVNSRKPGKITVRIRPTDMPAQEAILRELIHEAVKEFQR